MRKTKKYKEHLPLKLSLLVLAIILAADALIFAITYIAGRITGSTDIASFIGYICASAIIGTLLAVFMFFAVMRPLRELIKAANLVSNGDYTAAHIETGWNEKHTMREIRSLISVFNDMTKELQSIEIFRKDFISSFSHEFKTPLMSIRGFAEQLYSGGLTPEQQREFSKIILDETEYLSVLSANTLLLTRIESGCTVTDKTWFSLDEQLRNCMIRLEPGWAEKNLNINMEELDSVKYYWDEQLLAHVWNNLFENAIKFTPRGGDINVSCVREQNNIVVKVADTGCGIPKEALPHIFVKFYQADNSHATKGNGLGLSIVKSLIEMCGGSIEVKSAVDKGTEFKIILPDYST